MAHPTTREQPVDERQGAAVTPDLVAAVTVAAISVGVAPLDVNELVALAELLHVPASRFMPEHAA